MEREVYSRRSGEYRARVEAELDRLIPAPELESDMPALLRRAMRYSLLAGGKRLRPVLLLAVSDMAGWCGWRAELCMRAGDDTYVFAGYTTICQAWITIQCAGAGRLAMWRLAKVRRYWLATGC